MGSSKTGGKRFIEPFKNVFGGQDRQRFSNQYRRPIQFAALLGVSLLAVVALRLWDPVAVVMLRDHVFASYQQFAPKALKSTAPVKIIAIDAESQRRMGPWPWTGPTLTRFLQKLAQANPAAIGLTIPPPGNETAQLTEQIKRLVTLAPDEKRAALQAVATPLITELKKSGLHPALKPAGALVFSTAEPAQATPANVLFKGKLITQLLPLETRAFLAQRPAVSPHRFTAILINRAHPPSAQGHAVPSLPSRLPLLYRDGSTIYVQLAAAVVARAQGVGHFELQRAGAQWPWSSLFYNDLQLNIGDIRVPLDRHARLRQYDGFNKTIPVLPAWKILAGESPLKALQGHILLIGGPENANGALQRTAQAVSQILLGAPVTRPAYGTAVEIAVLCLAAILAAFLVYISGPLQGLLLAFTIAGGFAFFSWLGFEGSGLLLDPLYPALGIGFAVSIAILQRQWLRHKERAEIAQLFTGRLAPALIEEVQSQPLGQTFEPQLTHLTFMHFEIRGMPDLSASGQHLERRFARAAARLFGMTNKTFLEYRGWIEHFEGDAVDAVWNAPITDPDHTYHAATAVLELARKFAHFNSQMEKRARQHNRLFRPLNFHCGIDTAPALIGHLGATLNREFTITSTARNQARQLQELARHLGLSCLVSTSAAAEIPDLALLEIGKALDFLQITPPVPLPSHTSTSESTRVFVLLGDEIMLRSETFRRLRANHKRLLAAIAKGQLREAVSLLKTCHILGGSKLSKFYRLIAASLQHARQKRNAA